jgi:RNA polymerase sigma-70 factor (ECF subfamily)
MTLAETITNFTESGGRAAAMHEDAFQAIYDRTARPLWAYLLRVSGRGDIADDLLQETYCRFFVRNPPGLDETQTRSYLFRIATNLLHDRWRRGDDESEDEQLSEVSAGEIDQAARVDVRSAMQNLKPRERQLLWLAYVEGMNHAEIAAATGLSALSIRLLLFRARRRAAGLLSPDKISPDKTGTMVKK